MALVARPVGKNELTQNPIAQAALDVEWDKLMKKQAWEMESAREWESVSKEAQQKNWKVHVGKIFELVSRKEESSLKETLSANLRVVLSFKAIM